MHSKGGLHDAIFGGGPDFLDPCGSAIAFPMSDHEIELLDFGFDWFGWGLGLDGGEEDCGCDHASSLTTVLLICGQLRSSLLKKGI